MATSSTPKQNRSPASRDRSSNLDEQLCVNLAESCNAFVKEDNTLVPHDEQMRSGLNREQVKNSQHRFDDQYKYNNSSAFNSIEEMQKLRHQMQNMIYPGKNFSPESMNLSSVSSIDTIALLRGSIQNSPELQLDDNGILMSSMNSNFSTKRSHDSSVLAENVILKESLEKERYRRKHCEDEIHQLQNKLLESQEQLAVAISTEKKKELMIEQLDRTLAGIVEGWKKQEKVNNDEIHQLKSENGFLRDTHDKQDQVLKQFENDLAEAVDAFAKEQERLQIMKEENNTLIHNLEDEKNFLKMQVNEFQEASLKLEEEKDKWLLEKEKINTDLQNVTHVYNTERAEWQMCKEKFERNINKLENEYKQTFIELQQSVEATNMESQGLQTKLSQVEKERNHLSDELETQCKEKETLLLELSLSHSKYDALKTTQDSELRSKLEEEFNQQIRNIQKQISDTENELRISQKQQISELARSQKRELDEQKENSMQDTRTKDKVIFSLQAEYEKKIQDMEVENNDLQSACKVLQGQRGELMDRLKYIMQQQWHETLNLFQSEEKNNMINTLSTNHLSSTLTNDAENLNSSFTQHETSRQPPHNGNVGGNRTTDMHNLSVKDLNSDKMMNRDTSNKLNSQYPSYQEQSLNQLHQLASVNDKLSTSSFTQYNNSSTHQPTLNQQQQQQLFLQMLLRQQENNQQQQIEYNQQQEEQRTQLEHQVLQQKQMIYQELQQKQLEQQNQQHLRNQQQQSKKHHMKNNFSFKPKQGSSDLSMYGGIHKNNAKQTESNQTETLKKSSSNTHNFPYSVHTEEKVFDHSQYMKAEKPFLNNENNSNHSNTTAQYPNNSISENNHGNNGSINGNRYKNKSQLVARGDPFSLVYDDLEQVSSSGYSHQENAIKQRLPQNEAVDQSHVTLNSSRDPLQASHNDRGFQRKLNEQSKKQEQLSHFIEKLLQKSPGQPNDEDPHPSPHNGDVSVAGPSINVQDINHLINEYTPKNINKSQPSAFKKSVLRNKNTNSRIASDKRHNEPRDQNNQVNKHTTENEANVRNEVSEQIEHLNEKQLKQLMLILNNRTSAERSSLKADSRDHELSNQQAPPADVFQRLHKNILKEKPSKQVTSNRTAVPKDHRKAVKENRSVTAKGSTRSTTKINSTRK